MRGAASDARGILVYMADDALERLTKRLDAGKDEGGVKRTSFTPRPSDAPPQWEAPASPATLMSIRTRRINPFELAFGASVVFFIIAVVVAALFFFSGANVVSTKNVDVQVSGPSQIAAGDTLSLQIVITNRNAVPMQLTDLVVEFPPGTRSDVDIASALSNVRESLGTINSGESVSKTVKAVIFGQAGVAVPIKVSAEYHVPSSNAVFVSNTTYTANISQAPAAISVNALSQVVSGQATSIQVTVTSDSEQVLKDVLLSAAYPPGFAFSSSDPAPASGTATWSLGDIEPGGTRTITVNGTFSGEDGDQKVINLTVGTRGSPGSFSVTAPLATSEVSFTVTKPFISAIVSLAGTVADQHTIPRGGVVNGEIKWTNNLPVSVQNLRIQLALQGDILDKGSVKAVQGFYTSGNSTLVWDKTTDSDFANVAPGQTGTLSFAFSTLSSNQASFRNPSVDLKVSVSGSRLSETNVPETVTSNAETSAVVESDLALVSALSKAGGPIPPKADSETTYTVSWSVGNSVNALANTTVTATLPEYVRYIDNASATAVSYADSTHTVTWNVGSLAEHQSQAVSFQVGVTPSVSQIGQAPVVVSAQKAAGFDRFVQDNVSGGADNLTTLSAVASYQDALVTK